MKKSIRNLIDGIFSTEMIRYCIIGLITFAIDVGSFEFCFYIFPLSEVLKTTVSHIISWILSTTFSFFLNKYYVFKSSKTTKKHFLFELSAFFGVRLISLVISYLMLLLMINVGNWLPLWSKLLVNVFVVIFNYIFAKLLIFKRKEIIKKQIDEDIKQSTMQFDKISEEQLNNR